MPEVLAVGDHWLLTEWIVGTRLVDALQGSVLPATAWLESLARAHESGVAVGDRWGGNELLTADGTVVLIDFDLEFHTDGPLEELMALDLAVALRAVLRWTSDEHRSVRQIVEWWDLGGGRQYDRAVLATMVLNVDCAYRCGSVPTAQAVDALNAWLRATHSLALALSR